MPASDHMPLARRRLFLYAGGLVSVLVVIAIACLALLYVRQQAESRMVVQSQALVRSLELMFVGQIDTIDVALLGLSKEISREVYVNKADPQTIDQYLEYIRSGLPHTDLIRATNEQGDIIYGQGTPIVPMNVADRDYFQQLRDNPQLGLLIVHPLIGKLDQKARWPFARRINKPDGTFGGVVFASMQISDVHAMLNQVMGNGNGNGTLVLRDQDFGLIARQGDSKAVIPVGDRNSSARFLEMMRKNPVEGTYNVSADQSIDGFNRTYSYRLNPKYHFLIVDGIDRDAELSSWYLGARLAGVALFAFAVGILLLTRFVDRTWRREEQNAIIRKESALLLAESEERFRTMVDHNNAIILEIDASSGHILDANAAACSFYGWSRDVLCSKSISEINQLDPQAVEAEYQAAVKGARNYFIFPHRIASGEIRTVEVHSTPVTINGKPVLVSIIHDITSRIADENALALESSTRAADLLSASNANQELISKNEENARQAAKLAIARMELALLNENKANQAAQLVTANIALTLRSETDAKRTGELMEAASHGIHLLDEQGRLRQCSHSFARMLGYTQQELLGREISEWDAKLSTSQNSKMLKDLMDAPRNFETIHRRKDGSLIEVEINAKAIRIGGKNYIYASSRDITERKYLHEQIRQLTLTIH